MSPRTQPSGTNVAEFSVSEISGAVKRTMENAFGHVRVRGEVSGYRGPHSSGHAYFALADDRSKIEAVIWKGTFRGLKFKPEEGMEVVATGRVTTYDRTSKYQLVIESLEPAGAGALMALLEQRKAKLAAEGLFADERKRPLPRMPKVIGIVTSPTGAVIRDIVHRVTDRFPVHLVVWPARVQGETCGAEVAAGIAGLNRHGGPDGRFPRPDLIIVARGGGSLEDLWGFNDEAVVRAAAASDIPLISAVGHETDWTLIDLVADRRAPTPTGAAEMAVPVKADLEATLAAYSARHSASVSRALDRKRQRLEGLARALPNADGILALPRRRFDEAAGRLDRALGVANERARARFDRVAVRLGPHVVRRSIRTRAERLATLTARLSPRSLRQQVAAQHERLVQQGRGLRRAQRDLVSGKRVRLRSETQAFELRGQRVEQRLTLAATRLEALRTAHRKAFVSRTSERRSRLDALERLRLTLGHEAVLARGYAIVRDAADAPITARAEIDPGETLRVQMRDGRFEAVAGQAIEHDGDAPSPVVRKARPKRARKPRAAEPGKVPVEQGSLFD